MTADFVVSYPTEVDIVMTRSLKAPRALVFRLWAEPEHIRNWWGPEGFENREVEVDFRVGGHFRLSMAGPDGTLYPCEGVYREIVPGERIVYEGDAHIEHPCGAGLPPQAIVTVTFQDDVQTDGSVRTRLTVHTKLISRERTQAAVSGGYVIGWEGALNRLAAELN